MVIFPGSVFNTQRMKKARKDQRQFFLYTKGLTE